MKRLLQLFLAFLILINVFELRAQNTTPYNKKLLLGINWGGAWENADVHSRLGTGWGLTLEREIIANNTSVFGFSLRGRYLHTWMWGRESKPFYGVANDENLDGTANPAVNYLSEGFVYRNFYTKTDEFSLEGLLILNKLRAHSGFKIYGFGGIGATGYLSKINQLDGSNNTYDYASVSTFPKQLTKNDLNQLWDNTYETNAEAGKSRSSYVMSGAIGIGIGIKLSPNVYLGWEHKYTYTSTDMLDASKFALNGTKSIKNDRYHYSSLFVTVALGAGHTTSTRVPDQHTYYPPPSQQIPKPEITQLYPHENPAYIPDCNPEIKLSITNIASGNQITVLIDGNVLNPSYYRFDAVTEVLTIHTPISGNTIFSIIAENATGKDTKYVYTNCTPPINTPAPLYPVISIQSSSGNNCVANVVASVRNVTDQNAVQVIMDGVILSSQYYNFNLYNGSVIINAPFRQFTTITIRALSNGHSVVQSVSLSCNPPSPVIIPPTQQIPIININSSTAENSGTGNCVAKVNATISGVSSVNNIYITRNGILLNSSEYTFNTASGILMLTTPISGSNTFLIKAQNVAGTATSTVNLNCTPQSVLPSIVLIHPSTGNATSNTCNEQIAVKINNVSNVDHIDVTINGISMDKNLLHFDLATSILRFNAIITNQTTIVIHAINNSGVASQDIVITCSPLVIPEVEITSPIVDPYVSLTCKETVTAVVKNVADKSSIQVTLNGIVLTTGIVYDATTGSLTVPVNFAGRSELKITATGKGGSTSKSISLICQSAPKPVITIISPETNPSVSTTCSQQIIAQIENVTSIDNISASVNGIPVANNSMSYDATTKTLIFAVQFVTNAAVLIKATNTIGTTTQTLTLQCTPAILPQPEIQLIAPATINSISQTCLEAVKLKITNCSSFTDITVSMNNQLIPADQLQFDGSTGILKFQVPIAGTSTIIVTAKNSSGVVSKTVTIQCKPTVQPSVSILEPMGNPVISASCNEHIQAVVTNVSSINQIEVTYNTTGVDRRSLSYDTASNILSFTYPFMVNGNLVIKATNEAGTDSKTISLQCKPVDKPVLTIITPSSDPATSETCRDTVVALVSNIEFVENITATLNNSILSTENLLFDKTSGQLQIITPYALEKEIKITVTNAAGVVSQSVHITCSPVLQPIITLTNPTSDNYTSTTCHENILMTLTNISSKDQIQIQSNGVVVDPSLYTYNSSTGLLTLVTDIESVMTLNVVATNKTKSASKTIMITCNKISLPVVTIVSPAAETSVLNNCNTTVKAEIINVTSQDQLAVSVNGKILNAANYTFSGNILSIPVIATDQTSVTVTATNAVGTASDKTTLVCNVSQVVTGSTANTCNISSSPITNCTTCNDNVASSTGDITVDQNKKVCVTNNFEGNINMNGGQLVICGNATIHTINFNSGDIVITGNASFDNINMNNTASALRNYGTVKFSNITFNGRFENHGQATIQSDFNINSSAVFINTGTLNAAMSFNNNNFVCNSGTILVGSNYKDNGSAEFSNSCKLVVSGQVNIDHIFNNSGAVNVSSMSYINGSGKLTMAANAKWITDGLTVNGTIAGSSQSCASISVSSKTILNSSASISGKIDLCDVNGIDLKSGSIASTVTYDCSCAINMAGNCGLNDDLNEQVTICHNPTGSTDAPQTLTISRSILSTHLGHGDHLGACTDTDKPVIQTPSPNVPVVIPPVTQPVEEQITICHKPSSDPSIVQTITVFKSALSAHLAHGDHVGACTDTDEPVVQPTTPVTPTPNQRMITICHKQDGQVQTLSIPESQWRDHIGHGDHLGGCTNADMPVVQPTTPVTPTPSQRMITICHKQDGQVQTLSIPESEWREHVGHGDHLGGCTNADMPVVQPTIPITPTPSQRMITICHKQDGQVQTLSIPESEWRDHVGHGDHLGGCTNADIPVVQPTTPVTPTPNQRMITICHKQDGQVQTLTIPESQWRDHVGHGDHFGACTDADRPVVQPTTPVTPPSQQEENITICHKPRGSSIVQTMTISKSALYQHLAHGDHIGGCTDADRPVVQPTMPTTPSTPTTTTDPGQNMVTICHKQNGEVQTLTIPRNQLPSHAGHGDHLGGCTNADKPVVTPPPTENMVTICHKENGQAQTLTVPQSQVQSHMAHGDHFGVCTPNEQ